MIVPVLNLNRRSQQRENPFGRRRRQEALVVEDDHLAHRAKNFRAQKQKHHEGAQVELAVGYLECAPSQGRSATCRNAEGAYPTGHEIDGEHPHGGAVNLMRPVRKSVAPITALTENLERRNALHAVEEIRAQSAVGGAASTAALSTRPKKDGRSHQSEDGEAQENKTYGEIDGGHEKENNDWSQPGDNHLRKKLAKKNLQPFDAFAQYGQHVTGSALIELPRSHGKGMRIELSSDFDFDPRRSFLADPIPEKLQEPAQHGATDDSADRQDQGGKWFA